MPRFRVNETQILLLLAILVGAVSGFAVAGFRIVADWIYVTILAPAIATQHISLIIIPTLSGLIIALLAQHIFPAIGRSGVNQTKAAVYLSDGHVSITSGIGKFIAAALAVGSGHSVGPEDPSLHIGAAIGSCVGRAARLSKQRLRLMAPVGAIAGLAAAFNAPLSAIVFVIEEIVGGWSSLLLGAGLLAAVTSLVVVGAILDIDPLFDIDVVVGLGLQELCAYAVIGVAGGLVSAAFACFFIALRGRLIALPRWTHYLQPAVTGLIVGVIAYLGVPQVMSAGYEDITRAAQGYFPWLMLGGLAVLKMFCTALSITSGVPGGIFAPTLFVGAMLGGAIGGIEHIFFPDLVSGPGTSALLGMGALFAGFLRVPFTALLIVVEVSGDYTIILPAMLACVLAHGVARMLQPVPIFERISHQDGLPLPSMEAVRDARVLRVEDAMQSPAMVALSAQDRAAAALSQMDQRHQDRMLFYDPAVGWRSACRATLRRAISRGDGDAPLAILPNRTRLPTVYPDHTLEAALRGITACPLLPVVHRADPTRLLGTLTLQAILQRYTETTPVPSHNGRIPV